MAIDDNTSYELTGAQVKDLASKIKAKADSSSLATVATSGNYNDLTNQPTIPTVNDATLTIQQNGTSVGTFTANASSNATISLTDTTYSTMTGATSGAAGTSGLVPAPAAGDNDKYLKGDGTWGTVSSGSTYTAGNGISIDANNEIAIDTSVVAELSDIPTVNNGTLTIQHNGSNVQTFTANQSTNATANIQTIYSEDVSTTQAIDWTLLLNKFHPVGSIYMSATLSTVAQVENALGGTWVAWGAGRVPVGVDTSQTEFDTAEETGGSKTHSHGLDSNGHAKIILKGSGELRTRETTVTSGWTSNYKIQGTNAGDSSASDNYYAAELGGNTKTESTLQPYITCYMYKRTA